jgi:hypothetical protein
MKVLRFISFFKQRQVNSSFSHCKYETKKRTLSVEVMEETKPGWSLSGEEIMKRNG